MPLGRSCVVSSIVMMSGQILLKQAGWQPSYFEIVAGVL